jgi:predicted RNA binding protein YcfA (HicA-like mRNA interferase family)
MILCIMPQKIKQLIKEPEKAGFINRGGKGSHRNFVHQERDVQKAIEESKK